ncbi:MAG: DUF6092 family protein [Thermacetogeniaceae bacterium]
MTDILIDKKKLIDVFCFILASARGCLDEPPVYGPLRLLETYTMLIDALKEGDVPSVFLEEKERIESYMMMCMYNEKSFEEELNKSLARIVNAIAD